MKSSHIKELLSQTAIYGVGILLNRSLSFFLLPLYTQFFSPGELGLYNLIQSIWLFIILIYVYGLETSFIKSFIDEKDSLKRKEIYSTTFILITTTSIFFSILIYLFAGNITALFSFDDKAKAEYLIKILSLLLFFDTLSRFPLLLLRAELKAKTYFFLTLISLIVNLSLNVIFIVFMKLNIEAILYSYIISVIFVLVIGIIITKKYIGWNFSVKRAKDLVVYGNKFIYMGLFLILIDISDRFFLKYFFDESIVGIYSANYRLASVMSLSIAAFRFSWTPYFLNIADNPDNKKIIANIFIYFVFAGLSLFLIFSFFTEPIVKMSFSGYNLLNIKYQIGLSIVPIVLLAYFFSGLFANLNVAPFYANKTSKLLLVTVEGFIINIILNFILIPKYQMTGAALATLITYASMFVHIYFISQKVYKIYYDWKKIGTMTLSAILIFLIFYIIKLTLLNNTLQILINIVLIAIFFTILSSLKIINLSNVKILFKKTDIK
jgi:O-antigen/teichoic acid export membrane protein